MPHDTPSALEVLTADFLVTLGDAGTYTPVLTAATTNPTLGSGSEAEGTWQRNGHLITFTARFLFGTSGVNAGSGVYFVSLPFAADAGVGYRFSTTVGTGSAIGSGTLRDNDAPGNSANVVTALATTTTVVMKGPISPFAGHVANNTPFTWAANDRITIFGAYVADPAGLP